MFEYLNNLQHDQNTSLWTLIFGTLFIGAIYCASYMFADIKREGRLE